MKLGDRVIWQSQSNGFWAEKIGTVVFMGPGGWVPEKAPTKLRYWHERTWRDIIRKRMPDYWVLCRMFPAKGGGYSIPVGHPGRIKTRYWTARHRYRFEKCSSGIVVAVYEYTQLNAGTKQATIKKVNRPLFYAPPAKRLVVYRQLL